MAEKHKSKRRLKGSVRKTIGALFMATAVIVAGLPVKDLGAATTEREKKVTVDVTNCRIPLVSSNEPIYTTGDGHFQFAYVTANDISASNKIAVILGYDGGYLENGTLTVPDEVDAYKKYSDNMGTTSGYCAVSKNGNFLFYAEKIPARDANGVLITRSTGEYSLDQNGQVRKDADGNIIYVTEQVYNVNYLPCYYNDRSKWENVNVDEYYYLDASGNYERTTVSDYQPIKAAKVSYIGNQYLVAGTGANSGTWSIGGVVENPEQGVFRGTKAGNVVRLVVGPEMSGVGNYAFYGCSNLESISLGNGLDTIGNYAFGNCINMTTVELDLSSMVKTIGDHAFYNCDGLTSFTMPISVESVGDGAFENCDNLRSVNLTGDGRNVALAHLGYDVFRDCSSLESVEFPTNYAETDLEIGMWQGCSSLKFLQADNAFMNFVDNADGSFTFEDFRGMISDDFYFSGLNASALHDTASKNYIAFKYNDQDLYELRVTDDEGRVATYQVDSQNRLQKCDVPEGMESVVLPDKVGPYQIDTIWGSSFRNNCYLKEITIPSSVKEIQPGAFKGCHNLQVVRFTEPIGLTYIGDEAFQTQDIDSMDHKSNCPERNLVSKPSLYFVGPIDKNCAPFQYAMKEINKLNVKDQQRAYITYCSGWPENLLVQYDHTTGKATLIDYPTVKDISDYHSASFPYITQDNLNAASVAVNDYVSGNVMTDAEHEIMNAALNLKLPEGIEAIADGLFSTKEANELVTVRKTLTADGLLEIADRTFQGCDRFTGIHLMDKTTTVGDRAFEDCTNLTDVTISNTVSSLGKLPFYGCTNLRYVNFLNGNYYTCPSSDSGMILELNDSGVPYKVVELLQGRTNSKVEASELAGISEIAEGAFQGTNVGNVDLRDSTISRIPSKAFADTRYLNTIYFPYKWSRVDADAFENSAVKYLDIYGEYGNLDTEAFSGTTNSDGLMTVYCEENSATEAYCLQRGIRVEHIAPQRYYTCSFYDYDMTLLNEQTVQAGTDAVPPTVPDRPGYVFVDWTFDYHNITKDMSFKAQYETDENYQTVVVTFYDYDGKQLGNAVRVAIGGDVTNAPTPSREGYTFVGWSENLTNVQTDLNPHALYEYNDGKYTVRFMDTDEKTVLYTVKVSPGEDCVLPIPPTKSGLTFVKWTPSPTNVNQDMDVVAIYKDEAGNSNTTNNTGEVNNQATAKLYTLTVKNGLGTGSFVAGANVVIKAQEAGTNMEFVNWTVDPSETVITDKNVSAAIITMPAKDVTVTANFKTKSSGSGSSAGNTNGNTNTNSNGSNASGTNTAGQAKSSGTSVVIDKNGLSNTGVVSAVVNGSSDNFKIVLKEDANASELAMRALMSEFGDDLTGIKYFPMDISLYDYTGKNMVTDTTGLSISITIPLPDSMLDYAGNNKVASVTSGKLEKINAKFTTISGVPCITFKAEHFSPYVIYVNTKNLSSSVTYDRTPKTGDGIHPKWFLSAGLACISIFLFLKKDKKPQKVPVKARTGK